MSWIAASDDSALCTAFVAGPFSSAQAASNRTARIASNQAVCFFIFVGSFRCSYGKASGDAQLLAGHDLVRITQHIAIGLEYFGIERRIAVVLLRDLRQRVPGHH